MEYGVYKECIRFLAKIIYTDTLVLTEHADAHASSTRHRFPSGDPGELLSLRAAAGTETLDQMLHLGFSVQ